MAIENVVSTIVVIAFGFITALTIVSVFNIMPFAKWFKADIAHKNTLFAALIVEIVVMCVGLAQASIKKIYSNQIAEAKHELRLTTAAWITASRSWMNEPSGLTHSNLREKDRENRFLLGVDDEESGIFVLKVVDGVGPDGSIGENTLVVRKVLPLQIREDGKDWDDVAIEDLEGITYAGSNTYYALASHREYKDKKTRKILKLEIDPTEWVSQDYRPHLMSTVDLENLGRESLNLGAFLSDKGVTISQEIWETPKGKGDPQRYALEIEGIAWNPRINAILLGLKYPLTADGRAIVIIFDPATKSFNAVSKLDLGGHGISDLAIHDNHLLVASNPPQDGAYDNYKLHRFELDGSGAPTGEGKPQPLISGKKAKLEGVAVDGHYTWLAYDGNHAYFETAPDSY